MMGPEMHPETVVAAHAVGMPVPPTVMIGLLIGLVLAVVVGAGVLLRMSTRQNALEQQLAGAEAEATRLSTALYSILKCEQGVTDRIRQQENQIAELTRRQRQLMNADRETLAVEQVKKLLARGSSIEDIVGTSELSKTELELLQSVTRNDQGHDASMPRADLSAAV